MILVPAILSPVFTGKFPCLDAIIISPRLFTAFNFSVLIFNTPSQIGDQFDLSLPFTRKDAYASPLTDLTQNLSRLIFMKHTFLFFPDIKILFSHR